MIVDYLCNAFTPDRRVVWQTAIDTAAPSIKIRANEFAEPAAMVARMDELGIDILLLPAVDVPDGVEPASTAFEAVAARWDEVEKLVARWPGRFAALSVVDPTLGMEGVRATRSRFESGFVVGCYLHTHSWDRRFDHADYYPYYALATECDVPIAMQAGMSGGTTASECGRPIAVDRAALYFPDTKFVLSHLGWPWIDEAIAMTRKHANVFLGTASWPPRRWPPALIELVQGDGIDKVLFGTNFPTVGHRQATEQARERGLDLGALGGNAYRAFTRLGAL